MVSIISKLAGILMSLVTLLGPSAPQTTLLAPNSPVVASSSVETTVSPTPVKTPLSTPVPTPDIPSLVAQIQDLQQQIASYTPEPTPTPQIVYIPVPTATPIPTPEPECSISVSSNGTATWTSNQNGEGSITPAIGQDGGHILWDRASYSVHTPSGSKSVELSRYFMLRIGDTICYTYFSGEASSSSNFPDGITP